MRRTVAPLLPRWDVLVRTDRPRVRAAQWIVAGETATKRPEVVRRWVRAMRKGADWLNASNGTAPFYDGMMKQALDPAAMVFETPR